MNGKKAFSTERIPAVDEERKRAMSRQRQRVAGICWGLVSLHNIYVTGKWCKGKTWTAIKVQAPAWVIERLEVVIEILKITQ